MSAWVQDIFAAACWVAAFSGWAMVWWAVS